MTILFRPQGAFGWFSYTTSRDTIQFPLRLMLCTKPFLAKAKRNLLLAY